MWESASRVILTKGSGLSSVSSLNAFDRALQEARVADFNHSKLSSIVPIGAEILLEPFINIDEYLPVKGSILPTVWSECRGVFGETITSCLIVAKNQDPELPGLIFELSGKRSAEEISKDAIDMLEQGRIDRGYLPMSYEIIISSIKVTEPFGCVLSCAVYVK